MAYEIDCYPFKIIGPVDYVWIEEEQSSNVPNNSLIFSIHPCYANQFFIEIKKLFENNEKVLVENLEDHIGSFKLFGQGSLDLLAKFLADCLVCDKNNDSTISDPPNQDLSRASERINTKLFLFEVNYEKLKQFRTPHALNDCKLESLNPSPKLPKHSNLEHGQTNKLFTQSYNSDLTEKIKNKEPIENIQISINFFKSGPISCNDTKIASGFEIKFPRCITLMLWRNLIIRGSRICALDTLEHINTLYGHGTHFSLYPSSKSSQKSENLLSKTQIQKHFARPASKRVNYKKLGVTDPFTFQWQKEIFQSKSEKVIFSFFHIIAIGIKVGFFIQV